MARKRYGLTEARIRRFIREGRGKGTGKDYKPWFYVSDVPSRGRLHRFYCPLTDREHHLLSDNEYYAFLLQWWDDKVFDIQEQFPLLDRRETLEIAARCGVKHPFDQHSGTVWVMTTDLLVTRLTPHGTETIALSVKESKELANERTIEKLEIERRYWERREVPWKILTEQQVKSTFTKNLAWIYDYNSNRRGTLNLDLALIQRELAAEQRLHAQMPIRVLCSMVDQKLGYKTATTLGVLRQFLGARIIRVNLNERHIQDLPAESFTI